MQGITGEGVIVGIMDDGQLACCSINNIILQTMSVAIIM